jgi:hypothetical protein
MNGVQARVHFDITKKGRSKAAQALLKLLREREQTAEYSHFRLVSDDYSSLSFETSKSEPGVVSFTVGETTDGKLPSELTVLKPIRVVLTASGYFNFPEEGLYEEGGAEVGWTQTEHNEYDYSNPTVLQSSWTLCLTTATLEEAYEIYRRIRTGELYPKHAWVNNLPNTSPIDAPDAYDTPDFSQIGVTHY